MTGPHSPFKIARYFIEKAHAENAGITPMKLIKLVYVAHGWSLGLAKRPLVEVPVQAWAYGPVYESLYHAFKQYRDGEIPLEEAESLPVSDFDAIDTALLDKIWAKYGKLTGAQLSTMSHMPNTPWDTVWNKGGGSARKWAVIPDTIISAFYEKKAAGETSSAH